MKRKYPKNRKQTAYIIMYGKKPIAVFRSEKKAKEGLAAIKQILPLEHYKVIPYITSAPIQG